MQLSLIRLFIAVLAFAALAAAAETNAQRMARGLNPLPPRSMLNRSPTETAERRTTSNSPGICKIKNNLWGTKWCCKKKNKERLSDAHCYIADWWGHCNDHDYPHKRCCNGLVNICQDGTCS
ncbi:hypothetical protein BD626DRAFT_536037 [Schizophyllum amplum]|uniref:Uncharacterized protein n=1 Tax=Schizophyllum amplum TaxID=97359 RepID=A0A550CJ23_9AGAR|nr:hypothetical protein BD626DRAFT_536037 [Auriculariopsis ampla]